ncbi:MAG: hypothetical protein NUV67_04260 [archaeon]|nr:hypothetical protein [archaeon]
MISISAPGKIMLSGEWSVLEKGNSCIVLAVNKRVFAEIKEAEKITIKLTDFNITTSAVLSGIKLQFDSSDERLGFTKHAIETALNYIQSKGLRIKKFSL